MQNNILKSIIKNDTYYEMNGNTVCFILDDNERPLWSKRLNDYHIKNKVNLQMKRRYKSQKLILSKDEKFNNFFLFLSDVSGIKVDLASGPSGYFAPLLDTLKEDDTFIVTDACKSIISAHSKACTLDNFLVFDVDLDKPLPFCDNSIDAFSGNLLSNVDNYKGLLKEVYRSLKVGGKFALIEMFFDKGSKTYEYLNENGNVWASFETFKGYCESLGFTYVNSEIIKTRKGRISEGDLYPLDQNDCSSDRTIYFEKR